MVEETLTSFQKTLGRQIAFSEAFQWFEFSAEKYDELGGMVDVKKDAARLLSTFKNTVEEKIYYPDIEVDENDDFKEQGEHLTASLRTLISNITMKELNDGSVKIEEISTNIESVKSQANEFHKILIRILAKQKNDMIKNFKHGSTNRRPATNTENTKINEISDSKVVALMVKENAEQLKKIAEDIKKIKSLNGKEEKGKYRETTKMLEERMNNIHSKLDNMRGTSKKTKLEGTMRIKIEKISEVGKDRVNMESVYIDDIPWHVDYVFSEEVFVIRLVCDREDNEDDEWNCIARNNFSILNQFNSEKRHEEVVVKNVEDYIFWHEISKEELMNPENGYIKDDAITIEMEVTILSHFGIIGPNIHYINPTYNLKVGTINAMYTISESKNYRSVYSGELKIGEYFWGINSQKDEVYAYCRSMSDSSSWSCIASIEIRILCESKTNAKSKQNFVYEFATGSTVLWFREEQTKKIFEEVEDFSKNDTVTIQVIFTVFSKK